MSAVLSKLEGREAIQKQGLCAVGDVRILGRARQLEGAEVMQESFEGGNGNAYKM